MAAAACFTPLGSIAVTHCAQRTSPRSNPARCLCCQRPFAVPCVAVGDTLPNISFDVQIASTLIAALGFGGYEWPSMGISQCKLCLNSRMQYPNFFENRTVPMAGTEDVFISSAIGCTYWVVVAWIW